MIETGWEAAYGRLHRVGWSMGDAAFVGTDSRRTWLVSGSDGENLIRAEGETEKYRKLTEYHHTLNLKYEHAARRPWLPVPPDPPIPK